MLQIRNCSESINRGWGFIIKLNNLYVNQKVYLKMCDFTNVYFTFESSINNMYTIYANF